MTTELTMLQRAAVALQSETAAAHLISLAASTKDISAPTNRAGRDQCHAAAMSALKARTAIVTASKTARADATAFGKAIIAEEARLIALIDPEETRLKALRDAYDSGQERIKRDAAQREKERVDGILARIEEIRNAPVVAATATSHECDLLLLNLERYQVDASFAEFRERAINALQDAKAGVADILAAKVAAAEEAARVKAEQEAAASKHAAEVAEFNRQKEFDDEQLRNKQAKAKADQDERDRVYAEARKIEEDRIAAERAALAADRAKLDAELAARQAAFDVEQKRSRDAEEQRRAVKEAAEKQLRDAAEAERRKEDEAEAARRAATSDIRQQIDKALDALDDWQLRNVLQYAIYMHAGDKHRQPHQIADQRPPAEGNFA